MSLPTHEVRIAADGNPLRTVGGLFRYLGCTAQCGRCAQSIKRIMDELHCHRAQGERAYLGRKPSYTRAQLDQVRAMLGEEAVGVARIGTETRLTRQTVYRIKDDPASAEAALVAWEV